MDKHQKRLKYRLKSVEIIIFLIKPKLLVNARGLFQPAEIAVSKKDNEGVLSLCQLNHAIC